MKSIPIDLSQPFERVLTQALALPTGGDNGRISEARVEHALRCLYAAANGRAVETPIGAIPIAPAVAPWLKAAPLAIGTRNELLTLAGLSSDCNARPATSMPLDRDKKPGGTRSPARQFSTQRDRCSLN